MRQESPPAVWQWRLELPARIRRHQHRRQQFGLLRDVQSWLHRSRREKENWIQIIRNTYFRNAFWRSKRDQRKNDFDAKLISRPFLSVSMSPNRVHQICYAIRSKLTAPIRWTRFPAWILNFKNGWAQRSKNAKQSFAPKNSFQKNVVFDAYALWNYRFLNFA